MLSHDQEQEVVSHLQQCVPQLPPRVSQQETTLYAFGVGNFEGAYPWQVDVRDVEVGRGGFGSVRLARYDAFHYNCIVKNRVAPTPDDVARADREYKFLWQASGS